MARQSTGWRQNPRIVEQIENYELRVQSPTVAGLLWERVLTENQRQRLGNNLAACLRHGATVGMWMRLHKVSQPRAILDVAHAIGLLSESDYSWLLREVGGGRRRVARASKQSQGRPSWNWREGKLCWNGRVIRQIRSLSNPSHLHRILDAFQKARWRQQIKNPMTRGQLQLHQVLRSLNSGLKQIRFHGRQGGTVITWSKI